MTQHTPTPWKIDVMGNIWAEIGTKVADFLCPPIHAKGYREQEIGENEANAAHIVMCVNAHGPLIANLLANQELLMAVLDSTSEPKARKLLMDQLDANTKTLRLAGAA